MKKLFVFILLMCYTVGMTQSPFRFTSMIDHYTFSEANANGNIDISIPLYTIQTKGLTIPMSLNYNMNGNVNHYFLGGQFGDAWDLNIGGTISRSVTDIKGGVRNSSIEDNCGHVINNSVGTTGTTVGPYVNDEIYYMVNPNSPQLFSPNYRGVPDIYTFNVLGLSGKFTVFSRGNSYGVELIESTDFAKIEIVTPPIGENISTIYIYDKKGHKYEFGVPSNMRDTNYVTLYRTNAGFSFQCGIATQDFLLTILPLDIQNNFIPAGTPVAGTMHYNGAYFWQNLELSKIYDKDNNLLVSLVYELTGTSIPSDATSRYINGLGLTTNIQKQYLKEVNITGVGKIVFNNVKGDNRGNFVNSYASDFEIRDLNNNLIKKTSFEYRKAEAGFKNIGIQNIEYYFQKNLLTKITEYSNNSSGSLNTELQYNGSKSNGIVSWMGHIIDNGSETANTAEAYKSDCFILQKIKHPTGGSVVYDFESHTYTENIMGSPDYEYQEGNRIAKIAYYNTNVAQNILKTTSGEDAEKLILYKYNDLNNPLKSSGRVQAGFPKKDVENNVFYKNIETVIRGVGKKINEYNITERFYKQLYKDVIKSTAYDLNNNVVSQEEHQYSYYFPTLKANYNSAFIKPVISSVNSTFKNYEGTNYIESFSSKNFDTAKRVTTLSQSTDPLNKTTKSEFAYQTINNAIVNTQANNYINGNLSDQIKNTYDTAGNILKTEFKTPDMSAYENIGNQNTRYDNGVLKGYIQADGTPVTLIYGYNNTQIVAKIVNFHANVLYDLGVYNTLLTNIALYSNQSIFTYNENNLKSALNSLRTTFTNSKVTTYTYKPMVGISSITDENGKETTYEYDTFNRLKTIKDYQGNILKEYQYNFTN